MVGPSETQRVCGTEAESSELAGAHPTPFFQAFAMSKPSLEMGQFVTRPALNCRAPRDVSSNTPAKAS
jgi:hypothetical protein